MRDAGLRTGAITIAVMLSGNPATADPEPWPGQCFVGVRIAPARVEVRRLEVKGWFEPFPRDGWYPTSESRLAADAPRMCPPGEGHLYRFQPLPGVARTRVEKIMAIVERGFGKGDGSMSPYPVDDGHPTARKQ